ncbi:mannitol dehydrogenase, putative [Phytophthora infestans T30-4]|uniref:Mannitol dehydrogenase, putative n=1 Tax=Phytophthora infestans (strain T30-4) TaxID=403677 RepID=D0MVP8_PHYIT|nr:mannitol dehydrogenase, putative [Phytophthora infestans T30-4]EEY63711.1 mannitol dehydrogenase, putative [Phytophthora infestans T30-4]|eukprot:XP_002907147.1 mannitol dehydrogenase, putative [Phytophthora infestans T30-4]
MESGWGLAAYPCVVGHEIVGEVTLAGANVKTLQVGDRVAVGAQVYACLNQNPEKPCKDCADAEDAVCNHAVYTYASTYADGSPSYGGYADYVRVDNNYAFKLPENIPSDVAAPLMCAGATVFTPLKQEDVKAGDRVGVVGIEVRALGAKEFYDLSNEADQEKAAGSVDYLVLTADAKNMPCNLYLSLVRKRGTFIMVGLPDDDVKFSPFFIVPRAVRVRGSCIGSIQDIKDMLELASKKNRRPIIQKLPMSKVNEGLDMVREGRARYRVVLEN